MGVLKAINLAKAFGTNTIFTGVNLEIRRGDRIGLIGPNGAGKTTLLRCLLGLEPVNSGQVIMPEGESVGYVEQDAAWTDNSLYEELRSAYSDVLAWQQEMQRLEKAMASEPDEEQSAGLMKKYAALVERFEHGGGYEYEAMIRRVAAGLGFSSEDLGRSVLEFSGGQKTRVSLAKALLRRPDFLFLDEPTNHLDIEMVEWLEEFLAGYSGGMLIISHDRYFLDRVASRIIELENEVLVSYRGNYTAFLAQKAERLEALRKAYDQQQEYIAKTEAFIRRYKAGVKSKQARGRQSQLDRLERIEGPREESRLDFNLVPLGGSAERVAELEAVTASYGERVVFERLSLLIRQGEGVALVGPNGSGKSTILKLLTGDLQPAKGRVKTGSRVKIGYFAQEHEELNPAFRVIDEITAEYGFSEDRARKYLGAFLFSGDDVYKSVGDLSGGEKARLALLKLMLTGANFLILDEPTNHLDIEAKEAVEEAILEYPGTYLIVSHDRYFLDKIADRVVELADGRLQEYAGNYSYYREKKAAMLKESEAAPPKPDAAGDKRPPAKAVRSRQRKPDTAKLVQKLEQEIAEMEIMKKVLEKRLNDPASHADVEESKALADEYAALQAELEEKYAIWLELTEDE